MALEKIVSLAPGRTCLFGDHQDYLELPVIACAISRHITLTATKNDTQEFIIHKPDINERRVIDISEPIVKIEKGDHLLTALAVVARYGCIPNKGYDIHISGNVAINAGTSSSSAVVVAWIKFLLLAFGCNQKITKELVSKIAYQTEVEYHNSPGGKMDQYSIGLGNIMFLETDAKANYVIFNKPLKGLIVAESGIPKQTTGVLGELKEKALLAVHKVKGKIPSFELKEVTKTDLPRYLNYVSDDLKVFLSAAVLNHDITQRAVKEFQKETWSVKSIGALMTEHHEILKDYLKLTVPKIDAMINTAISAGALGAKIVGSGRGGSIVILAKAGEEEKIIDALLKAGAKDAYKVQVDPGARIIEPKEIHS
ncbi:galactokinase [Flagellimonas hymeniacidonis]|uniref:Galactokinase n=1 Tax=Flagellimonas hymeniacidonis TaxID=2603628 RepID=A0A5C8V1K8_9FLAO|nr:galactokinase family protein [Flagellimonas hymeniacidonis]TXN34952.1 galactokinase [Flagellimonas hymeniacidonis]